MIAGAAIILTDPKVSPKTKDDMVSIEAGLKELMFARLSKM